MVAALAVRAAVAAGVEIRIPLKGLIDIEEERARLTKEIAKAQSNLDQVLRKLANEKFVSRAPQAVVDKERAREKKHRQEIEALQRSMEELKSLE